MRQVFFLAYHLHWSRSEILGMPVGERRGYVALLEAQLEREAEAAKGTGSR